MRFGAGSARDRKKLAVVCAHSDRKIGDLLVLTGATGLERATSGVTGRADDYVPIAANAQKLHEHTGSGPSPTPAPHGSMTRFPVV
jgi:hypothetical protein